MLQQLARAEITLKGLVQGVGFRYFVHRKATELGVNGFVENRMTGEVHAILEGEREVLERLVKRIKIGPQFADVRDYTVRWLSGKGEFSKFEIR